MVHSNKKSLKQLMFSSFFMVIGAFMAAIALEVFLIPNHIIDGGIIGVSILAGKVFGSAVVYPLVILLNLPFLYVAGKHIGRMTVVQMLVAVISFAVFGWLIAHAGLEIFSPYQGDLLEIVVIGGLILGLGVGLIIRMGGCLDGTEILALLISKRYSVTVGNVILAVNALIFAIAGLIFQDWHPPIQSLITFFIAMKVMDMVIMGVDEMRSVMVFSTKPKAIAASLMHDLGLGLTFLKGKGGFSGEDREILYLMAERLQIAEIKHIVHFHDPAAFIAIENLHEVATNNIKSIANKQPR